VYYFVEVISENFTKTKLTETKDFENHAHCVSESDKLHYVSIKVTETEVHTMEEVTIEHLQRLNRMCRESPVLRIHFNQESQRLAAKFGRNPADAKAANSAAAAASLACEYCQSEVIKAKKTSKNKVKAVCGLCHKARETPLIKGKRPSLAAVEQRQDVKEITHQRDLVVAKAIASPAVKKAAAAAVTTQLSTNFSSKNKKKKKKDLNAGLTIPPSVAVKNNQKNSGGGNSGGFNASKLAKLLQKNAPVKKDRLQQMLK